MKEGACVSSSFENTVNADPAGIKYDAAMKKGDGMYSDCITDCQGDCARVFGYVAR